MIQASTFLVYLNPQRQTLHSSSPNGSSTRSGNNEIHFHATSIELQSSITHAQKTFPAVQGPSTIQPSKAISCSQTQRMWISRKANLHVYGTMVNPNLQSHLTELLTGRVRCLALRQKKMKSLPPYITPLYNPYIIPI